MSNWGQIVKSLKCQAKDPDYVLVRAWLPERSLAMVSYGHSDATGRLKKVVQLGSEPGEAGAVVQTRGSEGGRQAERFSLCPLCPLCWVPHSLILSLARVTMRCLNVTWQPSPMLRDYCALLDSLGPEQGKDTRGTAATSASLLPWGFSHLTQGPDLVLSLKLRS